MEVAVVEEAMVVLTEAEWPGLAWLGWQVLPGRDGASSVRRISSAQVVRVTEARTSRSEDLVSESPHPLPDLVEEAQQPWLA